MQTNDFEKLLSSQMEDFHLQPNNEVWQKVESRIKQEKKRRRAIIFWLLPLMLIMGVGSYFYLSNQNSDVNNSMQLKTVTDNRIKSQQENSKEKDQEPQSVKANSANIKDNNSGRQIIEESGNGIKNATGNKIQKNTLVIESNKDFLFPKNEVINSIKERLENRNVPEGDELLLPNRTKDIPETAAITQIEETKEKQENEVESNLQITNATDSIKDGKPGTINKSKSNSGKWKLGITALAGISNKLVDANSGMTQISNSPLSSPGNFTQSNSAGKRYTVGYSSGIGIQFQRQLTSKSSLSLGVNYHWLNAKTNVGVFADSTRTIYDSVFQNAVTVDSYYKNGSGTSHQEQFHYLQFPVLFSYQLNKNDKRQWRIYGGLTPAILVASNALRYNQGANIYYKSNDHLRKWNVSLQTGLSFSLLNKKDYELHLGPEFQYQLFNTNKNSISSREKLYFVGIKGQLLFKK